jgi:hypothetical protein
MGRCKYQLTLQPDWCGKAEEALHNRQATISFPSTGITGEILECWLFYAI